MEVSVETTTCAKCGKAVVKGAWTTADGRPACEDHDGA